jgi:hypothetical protein
MNGGKTSCIGLTLNPCCDRLPQHAPTSLLGLVSECEDLNPTAQKARQSMAPLLADRLGTGLKRVEDLPSALVSGRHNSGRCSIESCAEVLVGFGHAVLFQQ